MFEIVRIGLKHSVVRTLMDRAKNIPSTEEEALRETKRVVEALTANNYPVNFIHNVHQPNRQQEINDTDQRGMVILPYAKGFSERIAKVLPSFNIIKLIRAIFKSPDEWATTKQACRDESVVYLFLSSTNIYFAQY